MAAERAAGHPRHAPISHDDIDRALRQDVQRLLTIACGSHFVPVVFAAHFQAAKVSGSSSTNNTVVIYRSYHGLYSPGVRSWRTSKADWLALPLTPFNAYLRPNSAALRKRRQPASF